MPQTMTPAEGVKPIDIETLKKIIGPRFEHEPEQGQRQSSEAHTDMNDLCERYIKQQKMISFMVGARCLWENLVGGTSQNQKKKKEIDVSAQKIKDIDSAKKEK